VSVFIAMLALGRGFQATMTSSGQPQNAIVMRGGTDAESSSIMDLDDVRVIENAPQVARQDGQPLVSPEVVVMATVPLRETGTDANVQVRGVSPRALGVHDNVKIVAGRFLVPGVAEAVVGQGARRAYAGLDLGATVRLGAGQWTIVGVMDSHGTAFDSEVWADAGVLNGFYQRPPTVYSSTTVRLRSADDFEAFDKALGSDPRLTLKATRERDYYEKQSELLTLLIRVMGTLIAVVMGLGAVLGALNTMYSAVAERSREIAVLRAIGFGGGSIVLSFLLEALLIALAGGVLGCLAALPVNGITTGTINWQTFSHLAFAFRITPDLLVAGLVFALVMGVLGGLPPAIRAARANVSQAMRAL
jgi:putative ABC transport system permease protein